MPKALPIDSIESLIHEVRGRRVMLDADLAACYGVTTKVLNQAVRRNQHRFPEDFSLDEKGDPTLAALPRKNTRFETARRARRKEKKA